MKLPSYFYRNGLSIVFLGLTVFALIAQYCFGFVEYNKSLAEKGLQEIAFFQYFTTGHFIEGTFENWESEFLQMGMYVALTVFLRQKGSAESKSLDEREEVDRVPVPVQDSPWPVRKGGIYLAIYQYSLSIAFFLLFLLSFVAHAYGTWNDMITLGESDIQFYQIFGESRFWYESFQNWQSEFLSVASIVILTIFLRQKGSPESKPVDAPDSETGR